MFMLVKRFSLLIIMAATIVACENNPRRNFDLLLSLQTVEKSDTFLNCGDPYKKRIYDAKCLPTNTRDGTAEYSCWKYPKKEGENWTCTENCTFVRCCRPGSSC